MAKNSLFFLLLSTFCLLLPSGTFAQDQIEGREQKSPQLISSTGLGNEEIRSLNIDVLRNEIAKRPGSTGLILLYCSKKCKVGEIEAHFRGIYLTLRYKAIDAESIVYKVGGYRRSFEVEYWLIPPGAGFPQPRSSVSIRDVDLDQEFELKVVGYDCCELNWSWPPKPERISKIPYQIEKFLKSAPSLELAMQTREQDGKLVAAMKRPHEYKPNLQKQIDNKTARTKILDSFFDAAETGEMGAACYLPSHTLIATHGDRTVEIEICFACRRYTIRGDFGSFVGTLKYENKAEDVFNQFMLGKQE